MLRIQHMKVSCKKTFGSKNSQGISKKNLMKLINLIQSKNHKFYYFIRVSFLYKDYRK
jgi:hypothetical protein